MSDEGRLTRTVAKWRCLTSSDHRGAGNWETALPEGCGGARSGRYGWASLTSSHCCYDDASGRLSAARKT